VSLGTGIGEFTSMQLDIVDTRERTLSVLEVLLSARLLPRFFSLTYLGCAFPSVPALRRPRSLWAGDFVYWRPCTFMKSMDCRFLTSFNSWALADAMGIAATLPLVLALFSVKRALRTVRSNG